MRAIVAGYGGVVLTPRRPRWLYFGLLAIVALQLLFAAVALVQGDWRDALLSAAPAVLLLLVLRWNIGDGEPHPRAADVEWANSVLADAGVDPRDDRVSSIRALREAAPGLGLTEAKTLADRAAAAPPS